MHNRKEIIKQLESGLLERERFDALLDLIDEYREELTTIRRIARNANTYSSGHFCESRTSLQSIIDRCTNRLNK